MKRRRLTYCLLLFALSVANVHAQVIVLTPAEGVVSPLRNQLVTGQAPPGLPVYLQINGEMVDSSTVRVDGVFEFLGVSSPAGPVVYTVTARMRNGHAFTAERRIHILGNPDSIALLFPSMNIPADGKTITEGTISIFDEWGVQIPGGYFVTLTADSLGLLESDVDPSMPGVQLRLDNGIARFRLQSTEYVGPVQLTATTNAIGTKVLLYSETPTVPFMLVGSADGTIRNLSTTGATDRLAPSSEFESGVHSQGRIAAIGRGTIFDRYLMTLSIDTDRKLQDRIFRDLDPNSLYSLYGDNSIVTYEAQSTSPLYVKVERNRSFLMFGDFNTYSRGIEFSAYNRSFTGGNIHLEDSHYLLDAFGTVTNRKVVQEEIRGQGISGYYYLANNNIVTGSEKVRIEVRDRYHSEVVLSRKEKVRYSDYEIDYIQGSLYFKQPIPSLDDMQNPVYIVVSSEAISGTADNYVVGGTGEVHVFDALTLGATGVTEERSPRNYVLLGSNARINLRRFGSIQAEVARSSDVNASGSAWKIEGQLNAANVASLKPYYRRVDGSFVNPTQSGSGREVGTKKYGGTAEVIPVEGTTLTGEYYKQEQSFQSQIKEIESMSGGVRQDLWTNSSFGVKVEDVSYKGENPASVSEQLDTRSTLLSGNLDAAVTDRITLRAEYERNLRSTSTVVRPDALTLGVEYKISKAVSAYAQQKLQRGQGQLTTVGLNTKITDQTSVYGRYEIGHAISGERNAATIGLKNTLKLTDELTSNILFEKTKNLSKNLVEARTPDHDALSVSLEYFPSFPLRATIKGEYSRDDNSVRKGFDAGVAYRLWNDLSVLGKGIYDRAQSRIQPGFTLQSEYTFGIAYRPVSFNWFNMIGKLQIKTFDNQVVQPTEFYRATIASAHAYVEPFRRLELGIKYAMKDARDRTFGHTVTTISDFILLRPQLDITEWLNVACEARILQQRSANDMKVGYSTELGLVVIANTMVSVGYNFQAYKERDLVEDVYSVRGPYVTARFKFTERLFGLDDIE